MSIVADAQNIPANTLEKWVRPNILEKMNAALNNYKLNKKKRKITNADGILIIFYKHKIIK